MINKYWNGTEHAVLRKEDINAKWISTRWGSRGLGATNKAFCIWYHAKKTADADYLNNAEMLKTLEKSGKAGWGFGVDDLDEAFTHLSESNGKWYDNTTGTLGYNGKVGDYSGGKGIYVSPDSIPASCRNFLTAVDEILPKLQKAMKNYQEECAVIHSVKLKPTSPKSDWEKMNSSLGKIKTAAENVYRFAWLAPPSMTGNIPNTQFWEVIDDASLATNQLGIRANQATTFFDTVGKINDGLTMYVDATAAFDGDKRMGVAFAGLSLALTYVPVLGGFYGEIVKRIPGLVVNWKSFITEYHATRLNPEIHLKMKLAEPPKWRCATCGSM